MHGSRMRLPCVRATCRQHSCARLRPRLNSCALPSAHAARTRGSPRAPQHMHAPDTHTCSHQARTGSAAPNLQRGPVHRRRAARRGRPPERARGLRARKRGRAPVRHGGRHVAAGRLVRRRRVLLKRVLRGARRGCPVSALRGGGVHPHGRARAATGASAPEARCARPTPAQPRLASREDAARPLLQARASSS
jgi:hypothetical protein